MHPEKRFDIVAHDDLDPFSEFDGHPRTTVHLKQRTRRMVS